jgi:hypothetical protein
MCESIVDFEASGLDPVRSYPIQVAWSMPDGSIESHYIVPESTWTYWDNLAEIEVHEISRELLQEKGKSAHWVADRMNEALADCTVYWDGDDWDAFWLRRLFDAANTTPTFYQGRYADYFPKLLLQVEAELMVQAHKVGGRAHDAANDVRFLQEYRRLALEWLQPRRRRSLARVLAETRVSGSVAAELVERVLWWAGFTHHDQSQFPQLNIDELAHVERIMREERARGEITD